MTSKSQRYAPQSSRLLAELLIIIVGVLIALGIDEWRGRIADADQESAYLRQLIADLEATERKMVDVSQFNVASLAATESLLVAFENPEGAELDRINQLLIEMAAFDNPVPVLGTVDALISTGDLRLIQNAEIRLAITQYLSRTRDYNLVPLHQYEDDNHKSYSRIQIIAVEYGLKPRGRESKHRRNAEPDIGGFLANEDAYAETVAFWWTKNGFEAYRNNVKTDAKEFRELVIQSMSPE